MEPVLKCGGLASAMRSPLSREEFPSLFGSKHAVIGVVHVKPLPGSPRWSGDLDDVIDAAVRDARALADQLGQLVAELFLKRGEGGESNFR